MKTKGKLNNPGVSDREFKIIEEISRDRNLTQRKISHKLGLSLGMTNIILKRLASKGYIKVKGLTRRKVQYILTPKGFAEKTKRSYRYFLKTIHSFQEMKKKIQHLILMEYKKGETHFVILGDNELADIIELSLKGLNKSELEYGRISRLEDINGNKAVILLAQSKPQIKVDLRRRANRYIDVLAALSGEAKGEVKEKDKIN